MAYLNLPTDGPTASRLPADDGGDPQDGLRQAVMSGFAETGSEHAELRHGRPWLQKPFDPDELESVGAKALAGARVAA